MCVGRAGAWAPACGVPWARDLPWAWGSSGMGRGHGSLQWPLLQRRAKTHTLLGIFTSLHAAAVPRPSSCSDAASLPPLTSFPHPLTLLLIRNDFHTCAFLRYVPRAPRTFPALAISPPLHRTVQEHPGHDALQRVCRPVKAACMGGHWATPHQANLWIQVSSVGNQGHSSSSSARSSDALAHVVVWAQNCLGSHTSASRRRVSESDTYCLRRYSPSCCAMK